MVEPIVINAETREITVPESERSFGVAGEHNVAREAFPHQRQNRGRKRPRCGLCMEGLHRKLGQAAERVPHRQHHR